MQLQTHAWEGALVALAHEARTHEQALPHLHIDAELLASAYDYCESITALHSRSFHLASALLPRHKRKAARALYAFCRVTDDIVDEGGADCEERLHRWRSRVLTTLPPRDDLVALAWTDARLRYAVPVRYAEQLIEGVRRDLTQKRYATFDELAEYCYGVASTVGLMSMHIIGHSGHEAIPYAVKLGVALQLTNILRDIGEDWQMGRLYLPLEELDAFGLTEECVAAGVVTPRWRNFLQHQIARNRALYAEAMPGIRMLHANGRFAIAAAAELYQGILHEIEANDYDVFRRRAHVSQWGKVRRLPGIGWRSCFGYATPHPPDF
ncbi:MAG TPA: squalene/phytoene synthase family protein [Caldilineaceae bacterium]|nr:squalene/phytoene synthase family protein [Caldilineaceae bacterium]HRW07506.1 squalene/phytoene synthase family protein [Caldilineaceae bacterium]